jgi:Domain of unknown function (DUF4337)
VDKSQPTEPAQPLVPAPRGVWGMILTATPVALTALATAFAGLSSSEMTQAMYHRSLAAQHQSRAGDQWAFFQAKRIRGNGLESSGELLQVLAHPEPFDLRTVARDVNQVYALIDAANKSNKKESEGSRPVLDQVKSADLTVPHVESRPLAEPAARQAYEAVAAIAKRQPESDTAALVAKLSPETIDEAIRLAEDDADQLDKACEPANETVRQLKGVIQRVGSSVRPLRGKTGPAAEAVTQFDKLDASFRAAAMDYEARRYRQEAAFNRRAAEAYEVRVRRSGIESDRHRERSKRFFYSMLLAQVGATVSALALARAQRSLLWLLAALAGVVAVSFTAYVYLSY